MIIATTISENINEFATIAISGIETIEIPRTMAKAAPRAAPEATPRVRGDTRGFPRQPCIKAPAMAKAAPATIAINILGNLIFQIISDCKGSASSKPKIIRNEVNKSRLDDEPNPIANNASKSVRTTKISNNVICILPF